MLGRWLDRLHGKEERVTPISFISRNIGKQVVYICIKKMSIDLKWPQKPEIGVIKRRTRKRSHVGITGKVALTSAYRLTRFSKHLFAKLIINEDKYIR